MVVAAVQELERHRAEGGPPIWPPADRAFARRTARLTGYLEKFADLMMQSGVTFTDLVDSLRGSKLISERTRGGLLSS